MMRFTKQTSVHVTACRASELLMLVEPHLCLKLFILDPCSNPGHTMRGSLVVNLGIFITSLESV